MTIFIPDSVSIQLMKKNDDRTLYWIKNHLKDGLFLLEARSINDEMFKKGKNISSNENYTDHYRRYLDLNMFKSKFESFGFKILFKTKNNNLTIMMIIIM